MPAPTIPHLRVPLSVAGGGPTLTNLVTNPWPKNALTGWEAWFESPTPERHPADSLFGASVAQTSALGKSFMGVRIPGVEYLSGHTYSQGVWVRVALTGFYGINFRKFDSSASTQLKEEITGATFAEMKTGQWYFWKSEGYVPSVTYPPYVVLSKVTNSGGGTPLNFINGEYVFWAGAIVEEASSLSPYFYPTDPLLAAGRAEFEGSDFASPSTLLPQPASLVTVEQDSVEEIGQCVEASLRTPVGSRLDAPEFGRPDEVFSQLGPGTNADGYLAAIERDEPRARELGEAEVDGLVKRVRVHPEQRPT